MANKVNPYASVNPKNIRLARIVNFFPRLMKGGFLNPSHVVTNVSFILEDSPNIYETVFDIPATDIQSRRVGKGTNILVEVISPNSMKYLGPEGDWETMYTFFGTKPTETVMWKDRMKNFSETNENGLRLIEHNNIVRYQLGSQILAEAQVKDNMLTCCRYRGDLGRKLLRGYARGKNLAFPKGEDFSDN